MPIVDLEKPSVVGSLGAMDKVVTPGKVDVDLGSDAPDWSATFGAAFRQDNIVGSYLSSAGRGIPNDPEPGFNPWDSIKGTKYEDKWDSFIDVRNVARADAVKRQIDQESDDRKLLSAAPWYKSLPAQMVAGTLDLTTLLPGGAIVRGAKGGVAIGKSALSVGAASGFGTLAQETALQSIQETRDLSESAQNIGFSVLAGGILGAAASKLLSPAEWSKAVADIEKGFESRLEPGMMQADGMPSPASAGAAAVEPTDLTGNTIARKAAGALAAATSKLNPLLRGLQSPSPVYRETLGQLVENSVYLKKNFEGVATQPAVETLMKEWNAGLAKSVSATDEAFSAYVKSQGGGKLAEIFPGRHGLLTARQFREEVGRAMRRGDESDIPEVAQAAKAWRSQVFDPLKEAAIKAKLLPEDVSVDTALTYFSRMWNRNKLIAQEGKFKGIVNDYYANRIAQEFQTSIDAHVQRLGRIDQEIADLQLSKEQRLSAAQEIETSLSKMESDAGMMEKFDALNELHQQASQVTKSGDRSASKELRRQIKAMEEENDGALKKFIAERSSLRARRRNIERGVSKMEERSDALLSRLGDIEEANFRTMERLITKGQKLERDLDRLDADALDQKISDMADSYGAIARKAEASAARAKKEIDNINKRAAAKEVRNIEKGAEIAAESDAKIKTRLELEAERQTKFSERMDKLAERLRAAKEFDHDGLMDELRSGMVKAAREVSALSMERGAKVGKLGERLEASDPAKVIERVKTLAEKRAELDTKFVERWEVGRGAYDVDPAAKSANFREASRQIADEVYNALTGRTATGARPEFITIQARGPMKERTFHIPDELVEEFLESDVDVVGRRYTRIMGADVEMKNRMGSVDLKESIQRIREDYARLRSGVTDEKELERLGKRETRDTKDLTALRDLLRGQSLFLHPVEQDYGSLVRIFNHLNYLRSMGEVALASVSETVRPAMVHGLRPYMQTIGKLATNLDGIKMSVAEAQLAGNVVERVLGHRLATISEIIDPYASRGPTEAFIENMTNVASHWNGIRILTDMQKSIASVMTQNRVLGNAGKFVEIKPSEKAYMNFLGIDESMAGRIAKQFDEFGQDVDGVKVANTEQWSDPQAVRAFRAALNKDIDSIITTKGVADIPLLANTPTGRMFLQFKSFALASHQRVLLRGLQEDQTRFLSGLVAMSTIGMMMTYFKAISGNREEKLADFSENPGWWISEGLDKSGVLSVPMELSNIFEKATGLNPIKSPIRAGDESSRLSQKMQNRNDIGSMLGPTVGFFEDIRKVGGIPKHLSEGGEMTKGQKSAIERTLPFNSYFGLRQLLRYVVFAD